MQSYIYLPGIAAKIYFDMYDYKNLILSKQVNLSEHGEMYESVIILFVNML